MRLEDLMDRAAQYDEALARDIKDYVHGRKYGLVYEASKPEFVRMWKKPIVRGDLVNILPSRGEMEDTKSENDPSEVVYKVVSIAGEIAKLLNETTYEEVNVLVDDVVAIARFDRPIYTGLKEIDRIERGGDKPYHVVINGENYHALQTLVYAYQGMVDCIYIDPPYNTGAKDWKYNNNYVGADDIYRHSKWLTFMEDRLKLAKKLLNPNDSVLIVTIDEKEYLRLGLLLEQLFPEASIQMVSSVINVGGSVRAGAFSRTDEYLYFVRLGAEVTPLPLSSEWRGGKASSDGPVLWRSMRRGGDAAKRSDRPRMFYPVYVFKDDTGIHSIGDPIDLDTSRNSVDAPPKTVAVWPLFPNGQEGRWRVGVDTARANLMSGYMRANYKSDSITISYLAEGVVNAIESGELQIIGHEQTGEVIIEYEKGDHSIIPGTAWSLNSHNARDYGSALTKKFTERQFPFPKSLYAVEDCLRFFVCNKPDAIIVDFFAGSGTTLHAVMRLNHQDSGKRKCICITNNEVSEEESKRLTKKQLRQGDDEWEALGIAHFITWPRIRAAISGLTPSGRPIKGEYGVKTEEYQEVEGDLVDPETGNKIRGKFFKKTSAQSKSVLDPFSMADGFEENAIFFDLEYLEPSIVSADMAFENVAPILWLCGGCKGEILGRHKGFVIGETYAILFDPRYTMRFVDILNSKPSVNAIFIVTDAAERYRSLCSELPNRKVVQLYESYLRSFEINAIG